MAFVCDTTVQSDCDIDAHLDNLEFKTWTGINILVAQDIELSFACRLFCMTFTIGISSKFWFNPKNSGIFIVLFLLIIRMPENRLGTGKLVFFLSDGGHCRLNRNRSTAADKKF